MSLNQFIETWEIHCRINLYLLNAIEEENLSDTSSSKGRNIGEQFAHIHNVRLMWLKAAKPDLLKDQVKFDKELKISKKTLSDELNKSSQAIGLLLKIGIEEGVIKGFKPHPVGFLGYIISHESHHRGQIILLLKQSGHMIEKKVQFGIWEWGSR